MRSSILVSLAVAAICALSLSGCGSSDSESESSSSPAQGVLADFSSPVEIANGVVQDPTVAIDPEDGRVYVSWTQNDSGVEEQAPVEGEHQPPPGKNAYLAVSDDGGGTISDPVKVNDVEGEVLSGGNTFTKVTPATGDEVIVTWTRTLPFSEEPELAARELEAEHGQSSVRTARSTDGGRTFSPAVNAVDEGDFTSESYQTVFSAPDGRLYATWLDYRGGLQKPADETVGLRTAVSDDGGGTFSESQEVDELACECCDTSLAADSRGAIYLAYRDQAEIGEKEEPEDTTVRDSAVIKSTDGGRTWSKPVVMNADGWEFNRCPEAGPDIAFDGDDNLHGMYYTGVESGPGVYYVRSTDKGASFGKPVTLMTDEFFPPATLDLSVNGQGTAYLAWDDGREAKKRVHLARVDPDGETNIREELATGSAPSIAAGDGFVIAVWAEEGSLKSALLEEVEA